MLKVFRHQVYVVNHYLSIQRIVNHFQKQCTYNYSNAHIIDTLLNNKVIMNIFVL